MSNVCKCRKGHASDYDNQCKFCREEYSGFRRIQLKKAGVQHRGDGLPLDVYLKLKRLYD